jgi:hypothetical protein
MMVVEKELNDAISRVGRIKDSILNKRIFRGYSGVCRIMGGFVALLGAVVIEFWVVPPSVTVHLLVWGTVLAIALILNWSGVFYRCQIKSKDNIVWYRMIPAMDIIPILTIGAVFTTAVILEEDYKYLFGIWMCIFGVAHVPHRQALPKMNYLIGILYIICGTICLYKPEFSTYSPWPMGLVFFAGELLGGLVFLFCDPGKEIKNEK